MASLKDSFVSYVQESFQELKKVTWPTRHKAVRLTFIVLGFCVVMAAALGLFDMGFNYGYRSLVNYAATVAPPAPITPVTETPAPESTENTPVQPSTSQQTSTTETTSVQPSTSQPTGTTESTSVQN